MNWIAPKIFICDLKLRLSSSFVNSLAWKQRGTFCVVYFHRSISETHIQRNSRFRRNYYQVNFHLYWINHLLYRAFALPLKIFYHNKRWVNFATESNTKKLKLFLLVQQTLKPSQNLINQISKTLNCSQIQETSLALALRNSLNSDIAKYAEQHLKICLPQLIQSYTDLGEWLELD